jgi:hypothetical protein
MFDRDPQIRGEGEPAPPLALNLGGGSVEVVQIVNTFLAWWTVR